MTVLSDTAVRSEEMAQREPMLQRLHRVGGQVLGVERMVADGRPCGEVLVQISAVQGALRSVALQLLAQHTEAALRSVATANASAGDVAAELATLTALLARINGHPPAG